MILSYWGHAPVCPGLATPLFTYLVELTAFASEKLGGWLSNPFPDFYLVLSTLTMHFQFWIGHEHVMNKLHVGRSYSPLYPLHIISLYQAFALLITSDDSDLAAGPNKKVYAIYKYLIMHCVTLGSVGGDYVCKND